MKLWSLDARSWSQPKPPSVMVGGWGRNQRPVHDLAQCARSEGAGVPAAHQMQRVDDGRSRRQAPPPL